jgi:hypothetical protein
MRGDHGDEIARGNIHTGSEPATRRTTATAAPCAAVSNAVEAKQEAEAPLAVGVARRQCTPRDVPPLHLHDQVVQPRAIKKHPKLWRGDDVQGVQSSGSVHACDTGQRQVCKGHLHAHVRGHGCRDVGALLGTARQGDEGDQTVQHVMRQIRQLKPPQTKQRAVCASISTTARQDAKPDSHGRHNHSGARAAPATAPRTLQAR